ncbi:hypothetical protein VTN77DRAFT_2189 [Rasamsonia byssochlamydoides]|uniref:uncharacterized protein n=1 Tax=Rasamsonia byssochlamydoides TaxID=89139 RepID=UPI003744147B
MAASDVEGFTLLSLGLIIIAIRVYVRWTLVGPSNFQLDDYLMPLTGMVFTGETVAAYLIGAKFHSLTNSIMTPEQRATLSPDSEEYYDRVWGSKIQVIGWSLYACILWLLKFCVAIFYSRLTTGLMHLAIRVRIAYILLGATYIMVALSILLGCQPMHKYWQINPDPGNLCQPTISKLYLLWTVNISIRKKITLMTLFSGAAFVMMAGIIRAVTILTSGADGAVTEVDGRVAKHSSPSSFPTCPSSSLSFENAPTGSGITFLFSSYVRPSRNNPLSSKETGHELRKRGTHPLSIPQGTAWGSDEHILGQGESSSNGQPGPTRSSITVIQETVIHSEPWPANGQDSPSVTTARRNWGRSGSPERVNTANKYQFSVTTGTSPPS